MTRQEAIEILKKELACRETPERKCNDTYCDTCEYFVNFADVTIALREVLRDEIHSDI